MTTIANRSYSLIAAPSSLASVSNSGLDMSALDIKFHVKKTLKPKPNVAKVVVYGLSQKNRDYLASEKLNVRLEAGYNGENELLFLGQTRSAFSRKEGVEGREKGIATYLETGDSEKDMAAAGLKQTFSSQASVKDGLNVLAASFPQTTDSNTAQLDAFFIRTGMASKILHPKGGAVDRMTARALTDYCRSAGLEWSIQNGTIFIVQKGQPINGAQVVKLTPDSGLVGSPSVDHTGLLDAKSFILPGLHPGAKIRVESESTTGYFRIEEAVYQGDTSIGAKHWYCSMTCSKLG